MTTLNYDANGFIVGINRMKDGIDNVHDDTQEIIQILKSQNQIGNTRMRELTRAVKSANYRSESQASASTSRVRSNSLDRRPRISSSASTDRSTSQPINRPTVSRDSVGAADRGSNSSDRSTRSSDSSSGNNRRERDANGRFISDGSNSKRGFGLPSGGMGGFGSDVSGMDPVLDSLKEAKELLSPIGRAGKLAGRATKFSWSKFKSMKRREPLSNDETRHNRENEKLLDKIWKAIRKQGGRGGNLGRGLLGGAAAAGGLLTKVLKKAAKPLALLIGAGSLAMDWDNLDHKGKSEGIGGLAGGGAGMLAGASAGAAIGSVVPVIGTAIGGLIGGGIGYWIGSEGGEALGAAASPYIEDWTNSITAYNLPKKMSDKWNDGIKPFFSRMDEMAGKMSAWIDSKTRGAVNAANGFADDVVDFVTGGVDGITSGNAGANGAQPANLSEKQNKNQMMVYKAFRNAGMSDAQSRAMTAEIGRENGYQDKYLFGNHIDPANGKRNVGMMSWQKDRGENVYNRLKDKGHIVNGKMQKTQENLDEQARYAVYEMNKPQYKRTKREFLDNPNVSYQKASEVLAKDFIKWRSTDPKYAKHHIYRDQYKASIDKKLKPLEDTTVIDEAKAKVAKTATSIKEAAAKKQPASKEVKGSVADKAKNNSSALGVNIGGMAPEKANIVSSSFSENKPMIFSSSTSTRKDFSYKPANLPATPVLKIPAMPKIKERLDSGGSNKPIMLQSSNDTINQNLSDRGLAHAVTGGFGQDRYWG
ncbi:hypothetical protein [Psychrobacter sp. ASPA161_6]|uniref:hypothetical protein n=1 Tax=Psychrobacter sp. ASPA161_6 TaxID=3160962 RepID=UPI003F7FDB90